MKAKVVQALREVVRADSAALERSQAEAQRGATHAETRAEGPKDMRSTEASYLARGLAERAEEAREAVLKLEIFAPPDFGRDDVIAVGALVTLEADDGAASHYLLAPAGGGEKLEVDGVEVRVLTPQAPLAREFLGRSIDDEVHVPRARGARSATIVDLC